MIFYRYIRPVRLNQVRSELETQPMGGVALRFQSNKDDTLSFTHSRVEHDSPFSKPVAKRIMDERASEAGNMGCIVATQDTSTLVASVIQYCREWTPQPDCPIAQAYYRYELLALATELERIHSKNQAEELKAETWKSAMSAANFAQRYKALD